MTLNYRRLHGMLLERNPITKETVQEHLIFRDISQKTREVHHLAAPIILAAHSVRKTLLVQPGILHRFIRRSNHVSNLADAV